MLLSQVLRVKTAAYNRDKTATYKLFPLVVADGNKLAFQYRFKNLVWMINRNTFVTDVLLIPIESCDMVLGVQWLRTLGEISWNFQEMVMRFQVDGQQFCLKGVLEKKLQVIGGPIKDKKRV